MSPVVEFKHFPPGFISPEPYQRAQKTVTGSQTFFIAADVNVTLPPSEGLLDNTHAHCR